ncbi:MAG: hypothetical protein AMS18_13000, partial [Gemmatimonas sp. SG8_17]
VTNTGALATHVAVGASLAGNRQDVIWLIGDRDKIKFLQGSTWQSLGVIDGSMELPGYSAATSATPRTMRQPASQQGDAQQEDAEQVGNQREVTWLVAIEGDTPLKLVLTSQKGGTTVRELSVR